MSDDKRLIDCKGIMVEYDLTRAGAEALMRQIPKVTIDGLRKVYVRRRDVDQYLEKRTAA